MARTPGGPLNENRAGEQAFEHSPGDSQENRMLINQVLRYPEDDGGGDAPAEPTETPDIAPEATPEPEGPLTLADDAQVAWDGLEQPLTGKEIREGYLRHGDYTRKTQELSNQQKQWEKDRQDLQRWQQHARQLEAQIQQRGNGQQKQQPSRDELTEIWQTITQQGGIPTDRELKAVVNHIQTHGIDAVRQQVQEQRGQFEYVLNDYVGLKKEFQELKQERQKQAQERSIENAIKQANVSDEARDVALELARDMFHSFDPDESKGETMETYMTAFGDMFADRWNKVRGLSRTLDKADLDRAKRQQIPRAGGNATPSKGLKPETDIKKIVEMHAPEGGWRS